MPNAAAAAAAPSDEQDSVQLVTCAFSTTNSQQIAQDASRTALGLSWTPCRFLYLLVVYARR